KDLDSSEKSWKDEPMTQIARSTSLLGSICLLMAAIPTAQGGVNPPFPDIAGPEIWVDGPDNVQPDPPNFPDVAVDNEGRRIHVWSGFNVTDQYDIYVRRFDPAGNPLDDPTRVNTTIESNQQKPRVAVSGDGSFLVIFQSNEIVPGQVIRRFVVRSQAYNANGDTVGGEQLLSTTLPLEPTDTYADVAALRTSDGSPGGYAVVWFSKTASGSDTNQSIEGCMVDQNGVPGVQFQVNSTIGAVENWSSVTEMYDGGFLAVWVAQGTGEIRGRRFNAAGGAIGPDFRLNSVDNAAPTSETEAAIGWDGRVMVVWEDNGSEDPPLPPSNTEIFGRMFDADLNPLGPEFRINNLFEGIQDDPRVADFGPVGFLVAWSSDTVSAGTDPTQSIEARVVSGPGSFDADGDGANDNQVQYNVWESGGQNRPQSHGWYGRLATNWQSQGLGDETGLVIVGRDIEYCLFCDDFEWHSPASPGSLWRWTSTLGLVP
ncbi:MAG: hypothetical protein P8Y44_09500, partial [Acidobacteriota bacterium]